jgi:hypothetical protein
MAAAFLMVFLTAMVIAYALVALAHGQGVERRHLR